MRSGLVGGALLLLASCSGGDDTATPATSATTITTTAPTSTTTSTTTTTTLPPEPDCVYVVQSGDSLGAIAGSLADDTITVEGLQSENGLTDDDIIHPGNELDVCLDNGIDDVTGGSREQPDAAIVNAQQQRLNEIFGPYIIADLVVDGDSGPLTRQMLCIARLGLGLPASMNHLQPNTDESVAIMEATTTDLRVPAGAQTWATKWILIDKTCQVLIAGEGDSIVEIYPTSTGEPGYPTHNLQSADAYRFDPATDNGGWHDSTNFPSAVDEPLNGNMYKPLYFNGGQAIHGANYVPPEPRSKGCARTFPWHQDRLLNWIGIGDRTEVTWNADDINVVVTVQGDYRPLQLSD